jgi:hypothetical protein
MYSWALEELPVGFHAVHMCCVMHHSDVSSMQVADGKVYLVKLYAPWCGE